MTTKPVIPQWFAAKDSPTVFGYFAYYQILDIPASKAADEERFKDVLVLHTRTAGETDTPAPQKVRPDNQVEFIRRFPDAWAAFQGQTVTIGGTPLDALNLPAMKVMELSIYAITRMEHLANISDQQCESMGFGTKKLREEAKRLLAEAGKPVTAEQRTQEVAAAVNTAINSDQAKADLDRAIAEGVAKALAAMAPAEPAKRRGRPPKARAASGESQAA